MLRFFGVAFSLNLFANVQCMAQHVPAWRVQGDTTGAPPGCSASQGIATMNRFLAAMANADSTGLTRTLALHRPWGFVFSTGKFTPSDTFFAGRSIPELLGYFRKRAQYHERITLQAVTFNGWRGQLLNFGPIYFLRSANDLGKTPRDGTGKGAYLCSQGIAAFSVAPRPKLPPGMRMRADQALPGG